LGNSLQLGIRRLLNNGTYLAAFPLHEGSHNPDTKNGVSLDREVSQFNIKITNTNSCKSVFFTASYVVYVNQFLE